MKRKRRAISPALILSYALILSPPPLASQELGLFFTASSSDHPELPTPVGFGAFALMDLAPGWLVRLSYHRASDETRKEGIVCRNYSARIECLPEMVETSVTLGGLRGALVRPFTVGGRVRLGVGIGGSFNQIDAEATGITGRRADLLTTNTGQLGVLGLFTAAVAPIPGAPFRVMGTASAHWVNFRSCSGMDPPQYDPFCGSDSFNELEVGMSYAF
jgi:hypothetical protein